jgi:hypothetical protein
MSANSLLDSTVHAVQYAMMHEYCAITKDIVHVVDNDTTHTLCGKVSTKCFGLQQIGKRRWCKHCQKIAIKECGFDKLKLTAPDIIGMIAIVLLVSNLNKSYNKEKLIEHRISFSGNLPG